MEKTNAEVLGVTAETMEEARQIVRQISLLKEYLYKVSDSIETLLKRLSPVLRCEPPVRKITAQAEEPTLVSMAEYVRQARYSAETQLSILRDILHRLEI